MPNQNNYLFNGNNVKNLQGNSILYNDDFNTFDYVIKILIEVCEHTPEQAEQCAFIVHYSGKCPVKTGCYEDLLPRCAKLKNSGLTAEIHPCE